MIIGNRISLLLRLLVLTRLAGSLTHTVGYHSPPNLGPEIALYDGSNQILLEKVC